MAAKPNRGGRRSSTRGFGGTPDEVAKLRNQVAELTSQLADALDIISDLRAASLESQPALDAAATRSVAAPAKRIRALRRVSSVPLVFINDDFVDDEMCAALLSADSRDAQYAFATLVAGELFQGQWGAKDGLRFNDARSSDANNDASATASYPDGLHVDTNNEALHRSVTAILYLNDVDPECGGATMFPLADAPADGPAVVAATSLLAARVTHTRGAVTAGGVVPAARVADAALLEQRVGERVLRVQPQAGRLCIFFSRGSDGAIDPQSWHGGERLRDAPHAGGGGGGGGEGGATEKHILTLFKEVHYGADGPAWDAASSTDSFEAHLAPQVAQQRSYLEELAQAHTKYL
tara:strand:- start:361 stop:1413 length:1053 start_codon:yes stop_codon:yes gene_type:complete